MIALTVSFRWEKCKAYSSADLSDIYLLESGGYTPDHASIYMPYRFH